jgi:hypothetical protein
LALILIAGVALSATVVFPSSVYGSSFTVTSQNSAETRLLALLPGNASILTTSDIFPHVANRLDAFTIPPSSLRPGYSNTDQEILENINPQYIMLNLATSDGNVIFENDQILSSKVYNGTYGVVGCVGSVMLLKQGYTGDPLVYQNPTVFNSTNLIYDSEVTTGLAGGVLALKQGANSDTMWFGPYIYLPVGNYTVTYTLRISKLVNSSVPVITIDTSFGNLETIQSRLLTGADFPTTGWQTFTLSFEVTRPVFDMQFRGVYPSNSTGIYLGSIVLRQQ